MLTQVDVERMPFYQMGVEKGMAQGIEQGIERGVERGVEQGVERGRKEVAMALLGKGLADIAVISEVSGLTLEEIRRLAE